MVEYYVDPTATGDDDGTTQANAWTTLQRAIDGTDGTQPAARDTVLCKHTGDAGVVDETLTVSIDVDGNSGDLTSGYIKYIGVNSAWVNDGTQYVIDGNDAAVNCLYFNSDYIFLNNFYVKKATADGITGPTADYNIFINVRSSENGSLGFDFELVTVGAQKYHRCLADNNSDDGFGISKYAKHEYFFCCARDNTTSGFKNSYGNPVLYSCLSFDNGAHGYHLGAYNNGADNTLLNSVADGNSNTGVFVNAHRTIIIGNRITNQSLSGDIGMDLNSKLTLTGWNYFENNYGDNIQEATLHTEILYNGATTNIEDQSDTNQGYTSLTEGSEDYNLRSDATLRRTVIKIPTGQ